MSSIFISIISQDESMLKHTIDSAIENCSSKNDIHFGIIEQRNDSDFINLDNYKNIKINRFIGKPRGVGVARNESIKLYDGEDFILVIDSHTKFEKYWDENLIRRLNFIKSREGRNFVISQRCFGDYKLGVTQANLPYFDGLVIKSDEILKEEYKRHYAASCHFIFGEPSPFLDIQFDPRIYYLAEEPMLSLRLYSYGYKIFSIKYNPITSLDKVVDGMQECWRSEVDPIRMSQDFQILIDAFHKKQIGEWYAKDLESLNSFIKKSNLDINCVFKNLNIEKINDDGTEKVKNKIFETFSTNSFNDSIKFIMKSIASSGTKEYNIT